jgi:hypothetical protein
MFRQSKRQRSPQMAPQAVASWHVTLQSSPQLVLHSITLLHCVLQSSPQTVPQWFMLEQRVEQPSSSQPR